MTLFSLGSLSPKIQNDFYVTLVGHVHLNQAASELNWPSNKRFSLTKKKENAAWANSFNV